MVEKDMKVQSLVNTKNVIDTFIFSLGVVEDVGCFGFIGHLFLKKRRRYESL